MTSSQCFFFSNKNRNFCSLPTATHALACAASAADIEHLGTGRGALHVGPPLVPPQPAQRDRALQRRAVLIRRAASLEERAVDQLDIDAAVMDRLDPVGVLYQLGGGDGGRGEAAVSG